MQYSLAFEMIVRRKQLLCEAHVGNPAQPSYEASDYFMGIRYRPGGGIAIPSLTEHVAKRLHEEGQVLKEKRKMREAKRIWQEQRQDRSSPPKAEAGDQEVSGHPDILAGEGVFSCFLMLQRSVAEDCFFL